MENKMPPITVDKIIERSEMLEKIPSLISQLNAIDPSSPVAGHELAEIIDKIPNVKDKILNLVNSLYHSYPDPVSSIASAVVILGFDLISNMVITTTMINTFNSTSITDFDRRQFWIHSIATAEAVKQFAEEEKTLDDKEIRSLYIASILHDLGILILEANFPEEFALIVAEAEKETDSYFNIEKKQLFAMTHDTIGKIVAKKWDLPEIVINAIEFHHNPSKYTGDKYSKQLYILHLAHYAATIAGYKTFVKTKPSGIIKGTLEKAGFNKEVVKHLAITLMKRKPEINELVNMLAGEDAKKMKKKKKPLENKNTDSKKKKKKSLFGKKKKR